MRREREREIMKEIEDAPQVLWYCDSETECKQQKSVPVKEIIYYLVYFRERIELKQFNF